MVLAKLLQHVQLHQHVFYIVSGKYGTLNMLGDSCAKAIKGLSTVTRVNNMIIQYHT